MSSKEEQELLDHGELDHKTRISPPSSKEAKKEPQILAALAGIKLLHPVGFLMLLK